MKESEQSPVASQRVADLLAERILSGQLMPGARIKQDVLAEELNVSRIPVRDALRILETRGLVSLRANAGARVTALSIRDMEISYQIREHLEPMLLAESMPYLTEGDIGEMREIHQKLGKVTDVEEFLPLGRDFHWVSYRRHKAPLLAQIVERLWDTTQSYRRAYATMSMQDGAKVIGVEHELLLGAIERREIETAQAILVLHIRRTRNGLVNYSRQLGADPDLGKGRF